MKSYRTSVSQVGRHSKKASFRCPLEYARKSRTNPVSYIFKNRIMVKLLKLFLLCLTDVRCNQSPKKMNEPKLETVASEFLSSETSVSPSYTFGLPALRITRNSSLYKPFCCLTLRTELLCNVSREPAAIFPIHLTLLFHFLGTYGDALLHITPSTGALSRFPFWVLQSCLLPRVSFFYASVF